MPYFLRPSAFWIAHRPLTSPLAGLLRAEAAGKALPAVPAKAANLPLNPRAELHK